VEDEDDDSGDEEGVNKCSLVWEGTVVKRAFDGFEAKVCRTETFAREIFDGSGVAHYWDLALTNQVNEGIIE
jgi:U4/U6 small nuclear ribonucleoprotein PRP3